MLIFSNRTPRYYDRTWIDLPVVADAVGVHDVLEARRELVGLIEGRGSLLRLHPVENGRHRGAAPLLSNNTQPQDVCYYDSSPTQMYVDMFGVWLCCTLQLSAMIPPTIVLQWRRICTDW